MKGVALSPLDETEANRQRSRTHKAARKSISTTTARPVPYKQASYSSPTAYFHAHPQINLPDGLDSTDLLYEYLPLGGIEDWMAPVNTTVYRPHVVNQMDLAASASAGGPGGYTGRSKRYFNEDQL